MEQHAWEEVREALCRGDSEQGLRAVNSLQQAIEESSDEASVAALQQFERAVEADHYSCAPDITTLLARLIADARPSELVVAFDALHWLLKSDAALAAWDERLQRILGECRRRMLPAVPELLGIVRTPRHPHQGDAASFLAESFRVSDGACAEVPGALEEALSLVSPAGARDSELRASLEDALNRVRSTP